MPPDLELCYFKDDVKGINMMRKLEVISSSVYFESVHFHSQLYFMTILINYPTP
jgi:hypothetical protein